MEYLESRELLSVTAIERAEIPELYSSAELSESASSSVDAIDLSALQSEANASGAVLDGTTSVDGETDSGQTYVVTTALDVVDPDDGVTSLREAASLATSSWDTITFAPSLKGETILLSGSEITISTGITIDASALYDEATGTPGITIDAYKKSRVFYIDGGTADDPATLIGLKITGGYAEKARGGAICVAAKGALSIENSAFTGNAAEWSGGAIYLYENGTLRVENSTFTGNTGYYGGAIYVHYNGVLSVNNATFTGNTAKDKEGGAICVHDVTLSVNNSTFTGNTSTHGGAVYARGTTTLSDLTATGNVAYIDGGAIYCEGKLTASNFRIEQNKVARDLSGSYSQGDVYGGGIYNSGTMTLTNGAIVGNVAEGVYYSGRQKNYAYGGGIYNAGTLTATNVTIAGNEARYSYVKWSKYLGGSRGGGIYNCASSYTTTLRNVIIAENVVSAEKGATAAGFDVYLESGTLNAFRTLSSYEFENADENYAYDPNAPLFVDVVSNDCRLAPNSQAIDKGDNQYAYDAGLTVDSLDLSGKPRFVGDSVDLGAYERTLIEFPTDVKFSDYNASTKRATLTWTDNATNEVRYEIQSSTNDGEWKSLSDLPANATSRICYNLKPGNVYVYRIRAVSAEGVASAWASATISPTAAPTNVTFSDYNASTKRATLTWTDDATNEVRYEIQSSTNGGEWKALSNLAAGTTSRICYGLSQGSVYAYRIRAVAKDGTASAWVSATIAPSTIPTNVTFSDYNASTKRATLTWTDNATNEVRYEIQSSTNGGEWRSLSDLPANATSRICYNLTTGNVYVYRIRAVAKDGAASAWASATISPTAAPTNVTFSDYNASTKRATLTWTDNATNEVRYEIQSSTNGGEWKSLSDLPANATSRICYNLTTGNVYVYRIRAVAKDGAASAWASATINLAISESSESGSNGEASTSSATLASETFANPFDDFDFFEEEWKFGF